MNINLKHNKYVLPAICLPFLLLFFYVYKESVKITSGLQITEKHGLGMQDNIGAASSSIQSKELSNKLEAYRGEYKEGDGYTAISKLSDETAGSSQYTSNYNDREKFKIDSIENLFKHKNSNFNIPGNNGVPYTTGQSFQRESMGRLNMEDQQLSAALASINKGVTQQNQQFDQKSHPIAKEKDPLETFKAQMSYMDSITKANDPEYKEEVKRQQAMNKADELRKLQITLPVKKVDLTHSVFNTVVPNKKETFIMAVIDEAITGYAGSRIRIRLLEDITVGKIIITKDSYLYASINGFGDQRVTLSVKSILFGNKILPVKLDLFDMDGLLGLYVPESAFREFTKDLGQNSMQGVNLQDNGQNQFIMSTVDKVFQSTSSAIASLIRKNKAKIKYNSFIYLINSQELQNSQKNY